jgi:hypothetical protein
MKKEMLTILRAVLRDTHAQLVLVKLAIPLALKTLQHHMLALAKTVMTIQTVTQVSAIRVYV